MKIIGYKNIVNKTLKSKHAGVIILDKAGAAVDLL